MLKITCWKGTAYQVDMWQSLIFKLFISRYFAVKFGVAHVVKSARRREKSFRLWQHNLVLVQRTLLAKLQKNHDQTIQLSDSAVDAQELQETKIIISFYICCIAKKLHFWHQQHGGRMWETVKQFQSFHQLSAQKR